MRNRFIICLTLKQQTLLTDLDFIIECDWNWEDKLRIKHIFSIFDADHKTVLFSFRYTFQKKLCSNWISFKCLNFASQHACHPNKHCYVNRIWTGSWKLRLVYTLLCGKFSNTFSIDALKFLQQFCGLNVFMSQQNYKQKSVSLLFPLLIAIVELISNVQI